MLGALEAEFIDADVNRFDALGRARRPAAALRAVAGAPSGARATGGSCDPLASTTSSGRCCVWVTRPGARSRSGAALAARRSALVAKLFAEYYERAYADHIVRVLGSERG
jgi:hypothetical protein